MGKCNSSRKKREEAFIEEAKTFQPIHLPALLHLYPGYVIVQQHHTK